MPLANIAWFGSACRCLVGSGYQKKEMDYTCMLKKQTNNGQNLRKTIL